MGQTFESLSQLPRPFGPFTLVRLIAQGGMGQVFLALRPVEGEPTDEVCVVKTVRTDLKDDREAVGRFLDEARVVQKLDHAAIAHTLDAGVVGKTYYLAMEFISGRNLRDVQTRAQKLGRPVPDAVIFHALAEMLDALDYAHDLIDPETGEHLHIVHRDVSPHNVMLGFDGYVKLIDFGLAAHELKREMTRPGIMVGKLRYNAPEQVRDRAIDGRSDLYSAGVMLYEFVTGERFYEGLSEEDIWRVAMKGNHRPRLFNTVPADLRNILELTLTPSPNDRFASAGDMKDAVLEAARSRNLREMRRQSARFMGELFVEERQTERDMILQATGLAEARTRLFEMPNSSASLSDSASGASGSSTPAASVHDAGAESSFSSVGRTKIVSPAQVRGKLADLVSGFDPNAETVLPNRPLLSDVGDIEEHSDAFATSSPQKGSMSSSNTDEDKKGGSKQPTSVRSSLRSIDIDKSEEDVASNATVMRAELDDDINSITTTPRALEEAAPEPKRNVDENLRPSKNATSPSMPQKKRASDRKTGEQRAVALDGEGQRVDTQKLQRRTGQAQNPGRNTSPVTPVTSSRRRPKPKRGPPIALVAAGAFFAALLLGGLAFALVPPLVKGDGRNTKSDRVVEDPTVPKKIDVDPPDDTRKPPDDVVVKGVDANNDSANANANANANNDNASGNTERGEPVDDAGAKPVRVVKKNPDKGPDKTGPDKNPDKTGPDKTGPDKGKPPVKDLKTLRDQVDYLKTYCLERVACARSTTESAKQLVQLSPEETKQLMQEIPKCIARCQR